MTHTIKWDNCVTLDVHTHDSLLILDSYKDLLIRSMVYLYLLSLSQNEIIFKIIKASILIILAAVDQTCLIHSLRS